MGCKLVQKILKIFLLFPSFITMVLKKIVPKKHKFEKTTPFHYIHNRFEVEIYIGRIKLCRTHSHPP